MRFIIALILLMIVLGSAAQKDAKGKSRRNANAAA
jgi:hypothetical protein